MTKGGVSQFISLFLSWGNENICGCLMIAAMLQFNCLNACIMTCYIQLMGPAGTTSVVCGHQVSAYTCSESDVESTKPLNISRIL